jgi:tripartite-type tricarboxylate transporter receptor subunit TctC
MQGWWRKVPVAVPFCLSLVLCGFASAQSGSTTISPYPVKPIRMIVGFPPGGQSDTVARLVGRALSESLRQPIAIENIAGAAGNIAAERVARAAPDGYTLGMLASPQLVINPTLYKLSFDPLKDFSAISRVVVTPTVLAVHTGVPVTNLNELIAIARSRPGQLTYASSGSGTEGHLTGELLKSIARIDVRHVPYKGVVAAVPDLVSGRVTMMFSPTVVVLPLVREGKLRALAVTSLKRSSAVPQVPTIAESGYPGFEVSGWNALMAPAGTATAIIRKLQMETTKAVSRQELHAKLVDLALEPVADAPDELGAIIKSQLFRWAQVIHTSGIHRD